MNVSPLDLRQQKFRTTFRGLDPVEVTTFLMAVAEDYEEALRETDRMRQDVSRLEELVRGYAEQEKNLQKTLMSAQKLADDMRAGAEENALRIVRDAEHRSRLLLDKTQARVEDVQRDIDGLKLRKRDIEAALEASIQALRNTLDFVREQDDRDDKLLTYRPRHADPEARVG